MDEDLDKYDNHDRGCADQGDGKDTVSQEQFQPMMWCTRDFIFENLLSQPYVQK